MKFRLLGRSSNLRIVVVVVCCYGDVGVEAGAGQGSCSQRSKKTKRSMSEENGEAKKTNRKT